MSPAKAALQGLQILTDRYGYIAEPALCIGMACALAGVVIAYLLLLIYEGKNAP